MTSVLNIALPKGRLGEKVYAMFAKAGFECPALLEPGRNTIAVILGNGWYNCQTQEVWHFDKAPWQDDPKLLFELESDGKVLVKSDTSWKIFRDGAFRFNQLRNGETCDARLEPAGWKQNGFDDSSWSQAEIVPGPGGVITLQDAPPCKVMKVSAAKRLYALSEQEFIYDAGVNMTGWGRLTVKGAAGSIRLKVGDLAWSWWYGRIIPCLIGALPFSDVRYQERIRELGHEMNLDYTDDSYMVYTGHGHEHPECWRCLPYYGKISRRNLQRLYADKRREESELEFAGKQP